MSSMFCYQCEQTAQSSGCTAFGVCGKDPETAALQDLALYAALGVSQYAHEARLLGVTNHQVNNIIVEALGTTITNVNFDPERVSEVIRRTIDARDAARSLYRAACAEAGTTPREIMGPAQLRLANDLDALIVQGEKVGIESRRTRLPENVVATQDLLTYGIKGVSAFVNHAAALGYEDESVHAFMHAALSAVAVEESDLDVLLNLCLACGEANLKAMHLLDQGHIAAYGDPVPTRVRVTPVKGRSILVSGHDLTLLDELLKQTEGTGINVYTHGEMLPAHGYPGLKKHPHLVGNYGGPWQEQRHDFDLFPGAILIGTNCLQKPKRSYKSRMFTAGLVAWPGVRHVTEYKLGPVIDAALAAPGFTRDEPEKTVQVGFGHNAVLELADNLVGEVRNGGIRRFFLVGGCDGAKSGRNYYAEFAKAVPDDCIVFTLACGKYRFNNLNFGDINGIPRLMDIGQCNDVYSAIQIIAALARGLKCEVNELPLSLALSWYEQKACAILLTLLHLGIRNIKLGPTLPAFVTPHVLDILVDKFNIAPTITAKVDLASALD